MKAEKITHKIIEIIILAIVVGGIVHYFTQKIETYIGTKADNITSEIKNLHK